MDGDGIRVHVLQGGVLAPVGCRPVFRPSVPLLFEETVAFQEQLLASFAQDGGHQGREGVALSILPDDFRGQHVHEVLLLQIHVIADAVAAQVVDGLQCLVLLAEVVVAFGLHQFEFRAAHPAEDGLDGLPLRVDPQAVADVGLFLVPDECVQEAGAHGAVLQGRGAAFQPGAALCGDGAVGFQKLVARQVVAGGHHGLVGFPFEQRVFAEQFLCNRECHAPLPGPEVETCQIAFHHVLGEAVNLFVHVVGQRIFQVALNLVDGLLHGAAQGLFLHVEGHDQGDAKLGGEVAGHGRFAINAEQLVVAHAAQGIGRGAHIVGLFRAAFLHFAQHDVAVADGFIQVLVGYLAAE